LEESASALKSAMEQAKRSANDAAHIQDELRQEQDRSATLEKQRRLHETQIKELQVSQFVAVRTHRSPPDHVNISIFSVLVLRH